MGCPIPGLPPARRGRGKMLYVESSRLNYNPREFIGLLGLGLFGSHCSGIGAKFISAGCFPMRCLREEFHLGGAGSRGGKPSDNLAAER